MTCWAKLKNLNLYAHIGSLDDIFIGGVWTETNPTKPNSANTPRIINGSVLVWAFVSQYPHIAPEPLYSFPACEGTDNSCSPCVLSLYNENCRHICPRAHTADNTEQTIKIIRVSSLMTGKILTLFMGKIRILLRHLCSSFCFIILYFGFNLCRLTTLFFSTYNESGSYETNNVHWWGRLGMKNFKDLSIQKKLFVAMLGISIFIITVITGTAMSNTYKTMREQLIYNRRMSIGWLKERLGLVISDYQEQFTNLKWTRAIKRQSNCGVYKEKNWINAPNGSWLHARWND